MSTCNHHILYAAPADAALQKADIQLDLPRTALVVVDPQIDFRSPRGRSWGIVGESVTEQYLVPNLIRLFEAAKQAGITVSESLPILARRHCLQRPARAKLPIHGQEHAEHRPC